MGEDKLPPHMPCVALRFEFICDSGAQALSHVIYTTQQKYKLQKVQWSPLQRIFILFSKFS